jgi:hypothetical protein
MLVTNNSLITRQDCAARLRHMDIEILRHGMPQSRTAQLGAVYCLATQSVTWQIAVT